MKQALLFLAIFITTLCHAQVADSSNCVQVTVHAINVKTKHPIKGCRVHIIGNTGYSKEGYTDNNGLYTTCLYPATYEASVSKEKYLAGDIPRERFTITNETAPIDITLELDSMGPLICWFGPVISFKSKKSVLSTDAKVILVDIIKVMTHYPSLAFELIANTDSKGSAKRNMKVSEKYAKAVKDYLVSQGIEPDRLVITAYGETNLLNRCKDGVACTEEEHAQNRYVDFRVIRYDFKE